MRGPSGGLPGLSGSRRPARPGPLLAPPPQGTEWAPPAGRPSAGGRPQPVLARCVSAGTQAGLCGALCSLREHPRGQGPKRLPLQSAPAPATLVATTATFLLRKQASSTQGDEDGGSGEEKSSPPGPRGYKGPDGICFSGTREGWRWPRDRCSPAPPRPARVGTPSLAGPGGADGSCSWTPSLQCPPSQPMLPT